jgi:hypothetical protein
MNRRSLGVAALYVGALFVGTLAGGAVSAASEQEPSTSQAPARKAPPTHCKTTKDCPQDHVCTKVSDHKECTPTTIRPPAAPVVT